MMSKSMMYEKMFCIVFVKAFKILFIQTNIEYKVLATIGYVICWCVSKFLTMLNACKN